MVRRTLAWLGLGLLWLAAIAGVLLSVLFVFVSTAKGRELLASRLLGFANDAIAGRIELAAIHLLPDGRLELEEVRILDPDGEEVSSIGRATMSVDLSGIRSRTVGVDLETDHLKVLIRRRKDGALSIVHAFSPKIPSADSGSTGATSWGVKLNRISIRNGEIRYVDGGSAVAYARGLTLDARGEVGNRGASAEVRLRSELVQPMIAPVSVDVLFQLRDSALLVPRFRATLGETSFELVGEGDLSRREGRFAVETLKVSTRDFDAVAPNVPLAGDLRASLFAESNGSAATASLLIGPTGSIGDATAARGTAAFRIRSDVIAAGFDLVLQKLDPSRLVSVAPSAEITLHARGRATGSKLEDMRGVLSLSVNPSRLRGGSFGPAELVATAREGEFELTRLQASLPGAEIRGSGRYSVRGAVGGEISVTGHDLAALGTNLAAALVTPLPPTVGAATMRAELAGTATLPSLRVLLTAPRLRLGQIEIGSLDLSADLGGPIDDPRAQLDAKAALVSASGHAARDLSFTGSLKTGDGRLELRARIPELGEDPLILSAAGRLEEKRSLLLLSEIVLAYPGSRFALSGPARVTLSGPNVDRLDLTDGDTRMTLVGGVVGSRLRAHLEVAQFDISHMPRGVIPESFEAAGRISLAADVSGPVARPSVAGRATLADGALLALKGLAAEADLRLDGVAERVGLSFTVTRAEGGVLEGKTDLPANLIDSRSTERLSVNLRMEGFPVSELTRLAGLDVPLSGTAAATIDIGGTMGAPSASATADLVGARYGDWDGLTVSVALRDPGREARLEGRLDTVAGRAVDLELAIPLVVADLMREPTRTIRSLDKAPLRMSVAVPGLDLRALAGTSARPLGGSVVGALTVRGSLTAPRAEFSLNGDGLTVAGQGLGELAVVGQYQGESGTISADLAAASGGTVRLSGRAQAALGLGANMPHFTAVPVEVHVVADELDLGFLPAVAPGLIRKASGKLNARLDVSGPVADLRRKGTLTLLGGTAAIAELGEWTDIAIDASASDDAFRLDRFTASRGAGRLTAHAQATGFAKTDDPVGLSGDVKLDKLPIARAGQDIATIDLDLGFKGAYRGSDLRADVMIPSAVVKLPNKTPRSLQTLDERTDISIGVTAEKEEPSTEAPAEAPFHTLVNVVVPDGFFVKGDDPRIDIELKAEVTLEKRGGDELLATGYVETIRGLVEPLSERIFDLERGKVVFTGGEPASGTLDVAATYDNPAAKVQVLVSGPISSPQVRLSSEPALDESQIAMLIATGRTELKAGRGGGGTLTGEEAGMAALGALSARLFKSFNSALADKLPLDVVSVDSGQLRAGKYVTDKLYVGYTRRFSAQPGSGENPNEVRFEYQITPRWTFESSYGDANGGGASLIWSKDY